MLLQFTVGNYLSFRDSVTLNMVATRLTEFRETNIALEAELSLLKSAALYGANASGKSNLFKAIVFMKNMVLNSSKETQAREKIPATRFKLSTECDAKPSFFEVVFLFKGMRYRYGFEVDTEKVHSEWLFTGAEDKEAKRFLRTWQDLSIGSFEEGQELGPKTRINALFISVAAQFNGPISAIVIDWFTQLSSISGLEDITSRIQTKLMLKDTRMKPRIMQFLQAADLGIDDADVDDLPIGKEVSVMPESTRAWYREMFYSRVKTVHKKYDEHQRFHSNETLSLEEDESEGTKKIFSLAGPILDVLDAGKTLFIDELDSRLHPLITRFVIELFNQCGNVKNAQLIFATHDTNLLTNSPFRRDQIWFTEKDDFGGSALYSLADFNVRKDASFGKDYILGKYGAIPFVNIEALMSRDAETVGP